MCVYVGGHLDHQNGGGDYRAYCLFKLIKNHIINYLCYAVTYLLL